MCGIIGGVNGNDMANALIDGLRRLEYRGYDSAGLAVLGDTLTTRKAIGPVDALALLVREHPVRGSIGIAHTRWATHGKPTRNNAHPHVFDRVAIVHNGIVENHRELRDELQALGHGFLSETDSEVIPHLISRELDTGLSFVDACVAASKHLKGRYAFVAMFTDAPDTLVAVHRGGALVVGRGPHGSWIASDDLALSGKVDQVAVLEDGDIAILTREAVEISGADGKNAGRAWQQLVPSSEYWDTADNWPSHTRREIDQQPTAITRTLIGLANQDLPAAAVGARRILIAACGSSYYAGLLARPWFERLAGIKVDLEIASELPSRPMLDTEGTIGILISQSGETADTMAALEVMKAAEIPTIAVVNVLRSRLARSADAVWPTLAGREVGVAATKTFITQALALMAMAHRIAALKGTIGLDLEDSLRAEFDRLPSLVKTVFAQEDEIAEAAQILIGHASCLFLGRDADFAVAAEGALKFKELTYLHAEAYAAGELKHGPIAVVEAGLPVVACVGSGTAMEKTLSNLEEVKSRGAVTVLIAEAGQVPTNTADLTISVPSTSPLIAPLLRVIALQLLSYHAAVALDRDVDRPRNLAKSVTVE